MIITQYDCHFGYFKTYCENIEFTDNANDNSAINNENDLQDSILENVLNEQPLNINDEILYDVYNHERSPFRFNNTEFLDHTSPEKYMCYGYMTCNGNDMYIRLLPLMLIKVEVSFVLIENKRFIYIQDSAMNCEK